MKEIMTVIRDPKTFYFNFDLPKSLHQNLKHETEFIIKSKKILLDRWYDEHLSIYSKFVGMTI